MEPMMMVRTNRPIQRIGWNEPLSPARSPLVPRRERGHFSDGGVSRCAQRESRVARIVPGGWTERLLICLWGLAVSIWITAQSEDKSAPAESLAHDISYNNYRKPAGPWSIHVIRVPRQSGQFQLHAMHASGKALGLAPVTDQTTLANSGIPVAAINGDFYQRDGPYAGDPRGLQIMEGELISAPAKGASFCIDAIGEPHTINAASLLQVVWPNGLTSPLGLNEGRLPKRVTL